MSVGPWQVVIIALIVLLLFGAGRLSEIGKGLGEGIKNFKKGISELDQDEDEDEDERPRQKKRVKGKSSKQVPKRLSAKKHRPPREDDEDEDEDEEYVEKEKRA